MVIFTILFNKQLNQRQSYIREFHLDAKEKQKYCSWVISNLMKKQGKV
jgi:hypothetical protein